MSNEVQIPVIKSGIDSDTITRLNQIAQALDKIAASTAKTSEKTASMEAQQEKTVGGLLRGASSIGAAAGVVAKAWEIVRDAIIEVNNRAIANERHTEAVTRLGGAYRLVTDATHGAVTAEQALAAQQTIVQSGLRVSHEQLAAITRGARDYARATGGDTTQALQQLTEALAAGEAGGLRRFGISITQGATGARAFREALAQLENQQRNSSPATMTLAESTALLSRNYESLKDNIGGALASFLDFRGALQGANDMFDDVRNGTTSWTEELGRLASSIIHMETQLTAARHRQAAAHEERQRFTERYHELRNRLAREGGDVAGLPVMGGPLATSISAERRAELIRTMEADLNRGRFGGGDGGVNVAAQERVNALLRASGMEVHAIAERARTASDVLNTIRDAEATAASAARKAAGQDSGAGANTRRPGASSSRSGPTEAQRRALEALRIYNESVYAEVREHQERLRDLITAYNTQVYADAEEHRTRLRTQIENYNNEVYAEVARNNQRRNEQAAEQRGERMDLALERAFGVDSMSTKAQAVQGFADVAKQAWDGIGTVVSSNIALMATGQLSFVEGLKAMGAQVLSTLGEMAIKEGTMYVLKGTIATALGLPSGPIMLAGGAGLIALGALMAAGGAAAAPAKPSAGAGASPQPTAVNATGTAPGSDRGGNTTIINNFHAPVVGGREATRWDVGDQLNSYEPRTRRARED